MPIMSELVTRLDFLTGPWGVVGVGLCAALIVVLADWRVTLFAFASLSVLLTLLSTRLLPLEWAVARMLVGGLVALLWFMSARRVRWGHRRRGDKETGRQGISNFEFRISNSPCLPLPLSPRHPLSPSRLKRRGERWPLLSTVTLLRLLTVCLAVPVFFHLHGRLALPELPSDLALVCAWLWMMGFLALALSDEPLRAGLGLLTMSAGFQLFYAALEPNTIAIGVLGSLDLLLGLAVAYLMVAHGMAGRPHLARRWGLQPPEDEAAGRVGR